MLRSLSVTFIGLCVVFAIMSEKWKPFRQRNSNSYAKLCTYIIDGFNSSRIFAYSSHVWKNIGFSSFDLMIFPKYNHVATGVFSTSYTVFVSMSMTKNSSQVHFIEFFKVKPFTIECPEQLPRRFPRLETGFVCFFYCHVGVVAVRLRDSLR